MSFQGIDFLKVPITLTVDDGTRHWVYFRSMPRTTSEIQSSLHKEESHTATVIVQQPIYNGRQYNRNNKDSLLTLDESSFELVECPTEFATDDFYKIQRGDMDLTQKYYKEMEEFVQNKLQCDKVICVHHQVRNQAKVGQQQQQQQQDSGVQGYAGGAPHTDSSPLSGDLFALDVLSNMETDDTDKDLSQYQRYVYLNLWRNISDDEPIQDNHLAMLDERTTVKPDDYITKDLFGDGYSVVQYELNARHAETQKWFYFPNMTKQEGILFKQMDSDWTKSGRICFHMSVSDPKQKQQKENNIPPPRESIEVRMLCLWKQAAVNSMPTNDLIHRKMIRDPFQYTNTLARSAVDGASILSLLLALVKKIPILGPLIGRVFGGQGAGGGGVPYSGNPMDYKDRFVTVVSSYPLWPTFAKTWIESTMKRSKTANDGIVTITKALVDDAMGYQKTKHFAAKDKQEIVKYLLNDKDYMATTQQHFAPLVEAKNKKE